MLQAAIRSALIFSAAALSSSSSEPKRLSSSSSSSSSTAGTAAAGVPAGPYFSIACFTPGRLVNSLAYEARCLYQRRAWTKVAAGAADKASYTTTSAWDGTSVNVALGFQEVVQELQTRLVLQISETHC